LDSDREQSGVRSPEKEADSSSNIRQSLLMRAGGNSRRYGGGRNFTGATEGNAMTQQNSNRASMERLEPIKTQTPRNAGANQDQQDKALKDLATRLSQNNESAKDLAGGKSAGFRLLRNSIEQ
jgi:hypothetical protein